jgi:SAM-dependent methyltransferase
MISRRNYWDEIVEEYQCETKISCDDFHYGPLIYGDNVLKLLPDNIRSKNCLEIACGGAQNSIFLAKNGANCTACDASDAQVAYAEKLASENEVEVKLNCVSMEDLSGETGKFDLIHSAYGFNFADDFNEVIEACSKLINPDGILLFSMPHPLFSGEFLELDDEEGIFIKEYLYPPPDVRYDEDGNEIACSCSYSVDTISRILANNDFLIERICEPEVSMTPPYNSEVWEEYRPQLSKFPGTIIFKAVKKA